MNDEADRPNGELVLNFDLALIDAASALANLVAREVDAAEGICIDLHMVSESDQEIRSAVLLNLGKGVVRIGKVDFIEDAINGMAITRIALTIESRVFEYKLRGWWDHIQEELAGLIRQEPEREYEPTDPREDVFVEPKWWPKKASTRAVLLADWNNHIKPQLEKGDKLVDIAAQMNVPASRVSFIKRFAMSWGKHHPD